MLAYQIAVDILQDSRGSNDPTEYIVNQLSAVAQSHSSWLASRVSEKIAALMIG